jgi:DNA-binding NarL/FixJ family response regulator
MPPRPLHLLVIAQDAELRKLLAAAFEAERSIGSVRVVESDRPVLTSMPEPDVVLVDAGPPPPTMRATTSRTAHGEPLTLVLASDWSEATRELAEAVGAVAYLKKAEGMASITPLVAALASLASGDVPL